jgi:hypothetical protein
MISTEDLEPWLMIALLSIYQACKALKGFECAIKCPASVQLNGSAIPLYNSSSIYDKLLWAATWMYKATGDTDYLGDAESFYIHHIYDEGAPDVRSPTFQTISAACPPVAHSNKSQHISS